MSPTKRQALVLVLLVSIDAALKIAASLVLASGQPVPEECLLCVVLRVNPLGLGSHLQSLIESDGPLPFVMGIIFTVSLATFLVVLAIAGRVTKSWVAAAVISAIIPSLSLPVLFPTLTLLPLTTFAMATGITQSILWLVIWALLRSPFWKIGTLLFSAASFSNTLSLFYPPYRVVDYLWSSPLHRLIGFGVFNIADIFWLMSFPVFAIALVRTIFLSLLMIKQAAPPAMKNIRIIAKIGIPIFGVLSIAFSILLMTFVAIPRMKYGVDYVNFSYLASAIFWFICGIGAIKKKQWARRGLIFLSVIYIIDSYETPSSIWKAIAASKWIELFTLAVGTAFFIALLIFLFLPSVKGVFARKVSSIEKV